MRPHSILVVDDDPDIRDIVAFTLEAEGYTVHLAANGSAALAIFADEKPALVILDVEMPGLSGHDVARKIRRRSTVPILFLSSRVTTNDLMEGFQSGADDYVAKPFQPPILLARVAAILRRSNRNVLGARRFDLHCPKCATCVDDTDTKCDECKAPRPDDGWPTIDGSKYELLGRVLDDRLLLDRFIGAGGMGSVYRAQALDIRRQFACKVVESREFGADVADEILERFQGEIDAMSQLQNPHIVSIYESMLLAEGTVALIMDFVKGVTLQNQLAKSGRLPTHVVLDLARQIANGMHEAHSLGIVHRDLKPANVMVEPLPASGSFVRILDFGIARVIGRASATQGFLGTPMFASPEQCLGNEIDHRSDIYSLGCIMYACLTGKTPVEGKTAWKVMEGQVHGEVPSLRRGLPKARFPAGLDELVQQMLQKAREDRPGDMSVVIDAIDDIATRMRASRTIDEPPTPPPDPVPVNVEPTVGTGTGTRLFELWSSGAELCCGALRRDGARAAVADSEGNILIADVTTGKWVTQLMGGPQNIRAVSLDPEGRRVYALGGDYHTVQWDLGAASGCTPVDVDPSRLIEAGVNRLLLADDDGRVGSFANGKYTKLASASRVTALAAGPTVVFGTRDGEVQLVEANGSARTLLTVPGYATSLALSRDGYLLAILAADGAIRIVETVGGRTFFSITAQPGRLSRLAFGDDAQLVGMSVASERISLWRLGPQMQA